MSSQSLPRRLTAPEPGWTVETDVVIIGSGIAGLSTALRYVAAAPDGRVVLVTKDVLSAGSTRWAQGGIAAAVGPGDDSVAHMADTVNAGAGLCDGGAVHALAAEGPEALRWLIEVGAAFDRDAQGRMSLTREGGHLASRIAHAGGDATGMEIQRALIAAVRHEPRIEVIEHALALDALCGHPGGDEEVVEAVCGVTLHVMGEGKRDGVGAVHARAVVLATGGMGQVFAATTNPGVSTGDGLALAARAGARLADVEFVQFHPTVLWRGAEALGQQQLISEAVRGEGASLVDVNGRRFMEGRHELADLAPRDVVAAASARSMLETGAEHVYLDARHFGARLWERRFPTILAGCREHGIDPVTELIPVVPAAHYASGGVVVDLDGRSSIDGLFAVGEVARTGVHGANRLASNSLLEGLVFASRIGAALARGLPQRIRPAPTTSLEYGRGLVPPAEVPALRVTMSRCLGVLRSLEGLRSAREAIESIEVTEDRTQPGVAAWEATNLVTVASLVVRAAGRRRESRGSHQRIDVAEQRSHLRGRPVTLEFREDGIVAEPAERDFQAPPELLTELDTIGLPTFSGYAPDCRPELLHLFSTPHGWHIDTVSHAVAEDMTAGEQVDVTSAATIPATQIRTADVVARADGVVAGLAVADLVFWLVTEGVVRVERHLADGDRVRRGDVLMTVTARTRDLLTAERTALNFLTHLCGIATATRAWADAIAETGARVRDTRKTHPGLRALEKYAVRCGGGTNHRFGLSDAALIKDNHVLAAGGVAEAVRAVREAYPDVALEVEVDRIDQIEPALRAGAEELLLDNFAVEKLREAVALVAGRARLEASGGLSLALAKDVAATGVDYLAVGALTHSSPALDIALDLREGADS